MPYTNIKQGLIDNIQEIGISDSTGRIDSGLSIVGGTGSLNVAKLYIQGIDAKHFPAYPNTIATTSLADIIRLGQLKAVEIHNVYIEFINDLGELLYLFEGKVLQGDHIRVVPTVDLNEYYVDESVIVDTDVTSDINLAVVIPYKSDVGNTVRVEVTWVNTAGTVLETYSGDVRVGANIYISPHIIDGAVYDLGSVGFAITVKEPITKTITVPKWCSVLITWCDDDDHTILDQYSGTLSEGTRLVYVPKIDKTLYIVQDIDREIVDDVVETVYVEDVSIEVTVYLVDQHSNVVNQFNVRGEINTTKYFDTPKADHCDTILSRYPVTFTATFDNTIHVYQTIGKDIDVKLIDDTGDVVYSRIVTVNATSTQTIVVPEIDGYIRIRETVVVDYDSENVVSIRAYNKLYIITVDLKDTQGNVIHTTPVVGALGQTVTITPPATEDYEITSSELGFKITEQIVNDLYHSIVAYGEIGEITVVAKDDNGNTISSKTYYGVIGTVIAVPGEPVDGYEVVDEIITLMFTKENDKSTITITNYLKLYTLNINMKYGYTVDDNIPRNSVGIDTNGDGEIDQLLTLTRQIAYNRTYEIAIGNVDGYTRKYETYTLVVDEKVINDRINQTYVMLDLVAYTRNFYCQLVLGDYSSQSVPIVTTDLIQIPYNERVDTEIPPLEGYRINSALYDKDSEKYTVQVEVTEDDPDKVYVFASFAISGVYCIDTLDIVVSYIRAVRLGGKYTTHCYIWYNRGDKLDDVTLTVTNSSGSVNKAFAITGQRGLMDITLDSECDTAVDYSGQTFTFVVSDNSDQPYTMTVMFDVPANYAENDHSARNPELGNLSVSYVNADNNTCYGVINTYNVPRNVVIAQFDPVLNCPSNFLGLRNLETSLVDLVPATRGAVVNISSDNVFDYYTVGVFDLACTLNKTTSIDSTSSKLVDIGGLKVRVPIEKTKSEVEPVVDPETGELIETEPQSEPFFLDDITYNSDGSFVSSFDNTKWTSLVDSYGDLYSTNQPLYFVVLVGAKVIDEETGDVEYAIVTGNGLIDSSSHIDCTKANTIVNLSCPTTLFTFDSISPMAITTQCDGHFGDGCVIEKGTLIIPQLTELVTSDVDIGEIIFDNSQQNLLDPTYPFSEKWYQHFNLTKQTRYNVLGSTPNIEQVEITIQLGVD